MRDEMIGAVVRRAIEHPEFRNRLLENPKDALTDHGFALEASDMAEIVGLSRTLSSSSADGDVEQQLITIAERYGVHPRPEGDKR